MSASTGAVVAAARGWLGTPYRHQASMKGAGCDCLGLVRGVWREVYGAEPEAPPPYRADWAENGAEETLLKAARRHLIEQPDLTAHPGDVLLFRMTPKACVKHAAIVSAAHPSEPHPRIIHAYWGRAVVESWLGPWWRRRLTHRFAFPFLPRSGAYGGGGPRSGGGGESWTPALGPCPLHHPAGGPPPPQRFACRGGK